MTYIRKTQSNVVYYIEEKGRLERINNVTTLITTCKQCGKDIRKKCCKSEFEKRQYWLCSIDCLNESQRSGIVKAKKEEHFMQKYGVKNIYATKEMAERRRVAAQDRYGVDNVSSAPEVKLKKSISMKKLFAESDIVERRKRHH